jgi:hypothetical protein
MQRIRIGLTGLAFVFLLVLLGTAVLRSSGEDTNQTANLSVPNEPLAELGVAPGQSEADNGANLAENAAQ